VWLHCTTNIVMSSVSITNLIVNSITVPLVNSFA
jgi:hypothetical protein